MTDLNKMVDDLSKLSVMEAAELSKLLQEKWGVSAAAPCSSSSSSRRRLQMNKNLLKKILLI